MDARLGRRDSTQARRSDGGGGIDMKLLWENRRKYAHESQSDALPEARFISFAADNAGPNYGKRFESHELDVSLDFACDSWIEKWQPDRGTAREDEDESVRP